MMTARTAITIGISDILDLSAQRFAQESIDDDSRDHHDEVVKVIGQFGYHASAP